MANKRYDAIFVGNGLIAFCAAVLLAKKGRSVLLVDPVLPSSNLSFRFSEGPLFYLGYEHGGAVEGFFSKLAYPIPSLKQKGLLYQKVAPLLQIVQSSHRSNIYSDQSSYLDELKREYGTQAQKLKNLFNQVERDAVPYYPFLGQFQQLEIAGVGERLTEWRKHLDFSQAVRAQQKNRAVDYLAQYALNQDLKEYFNLLSLFSSQKPLSQLSAFELILLLSLLQKGGVRMPGGYETIVTFFHQLIKDFRGTVIQGESVEKIKNQGKMISEITLSNGTTVQSNHYVLSQAAGNRNLPFHFTIPKNLLPRPMKELLLLTWSGKCPAYLEDILVLRLDQSDEADSEVCKIAVSVFLKKQIVISEADKRSLGKHILERLNILIPFSSSEILARPLPKPKKIRPSSDQHIFAQLNSGGEANGTERELLKGAATYYQDKENKNVTVLESDQDNMLGWGSDFIVGTLLADVLDRSK